MVDGVQPDIQSLISELSNGLGHDAFQAARTYVKGSL